MCFLGTNLCNNYNFEIAQIEVFLEFSRPLFTKIVLLFCLFELQFWNFAAMLFVIPFGIYLNFRLFSEYSFFLFQRKQKCMILQQLKQSSRFFFLDFWVYL